MPEVKDLWYVRFPDGRIRGGTAAIIRQQIASGRVPHTCRVRRSGEPEWHPIDRIAEFSVDTPASTNGTASGPPATIASRLDADQLSLAGLRPLLEELFGALDSTFVSRKLKAAAFAGLLLGGLASLTNLPRFGFAAWPPGLGWLLVLAGVVVWSWLAVVLSKMTFVELSRLRPATWSDGLSGSFSATIHLSAAHGVVALALGVVVFGLRLLPGCLESLATEDTARYCTLAAQAASVAGTVVELFVWPVFVLLLPLATMQVVEQGTVLTSLGGWLRLVWRKGRRLLLAEFVALAIGLLLTAPLTLLGLFVSSRFADGDMVGAFARPVLAGLLSSLLLAYLIVANVFIYLSEGAGR